MPARYTRARQVGRDSQCPSPLEWLSVQSPMRPGVNLDHGSALSRVDDRLNRILRRGDLVLVSEEGAPVRLRLVKPARSQYGYFQLGARTPSRTRSISERSSRFYGWLKNPDDAARKSDVSNLRNRGKWLCKRLLLPPPGAILKPCSTCSWATRFLSRNRIN